jgi:hypothetical protein
MKKIPAFLIACLLALTFSVRADIPAGIFSFKNVDPLQLLDIYQKVSGLELQIAPDVRRSTAKISFESTKPMTKTEALKLIEKALSEQANVKIIKTDEKHATVSLEKKTDKP